jgi:hypothetical protein
VDDNVSLHVVAETKVTFLALEFRPFIYHISSHFIDNYPNEDLHASEAFYGKQRVPQLLKTFPSLMAPADSLSHTSRSIFRSYHEFHINT